MKRSFLTVAALGASLLGTGYLLGQSGQGQTKSGATPSISLPTTSSTTTSTAPATTSAPVTVAAPAAPVRNKLFKISTLPNVTANREFQNNVQILQAQRQQAVELNNQVEAEKDPKKKAELKTKLEQAMAKLNENNDKMTKAYGFSLSRDYVMEVEVANVYVLVTEEEAAKLEAELKKAEATKKK